MQKINDLLFGTAGIPLQTSPKNTVSGIEYVAKLGLNAMELEFVQNINIKEDQALIVNKTAKKNNIALTCHGQYFINLCSIENEKINASKQRIYLAAKRAFQCGAWSMCYHSGFYQGQNQTIAFEKILFALKDVMKKLKDENINIWVRPETMGKQTQFGTIDETIKLSLEIENVLPCIDFSHLCARSNGKINSLKEFSNILEKLEKELGKQSLKNMHIHAQGIEFTEKGEKKHLPFNESIFSYKDLAIALKNFNAQGIIICESPLMETDALLFQQAYKKL